MLKGGFYFDEITGLNSTWIVKFVKKFSRLLKKQKKIRNRSIHCNDNNCYRLIHQVIQDIQQFILARLQADRSISRQVHYIFVVVKCLKTPIFFILTTIINIYI